jgi:ATP-dependent helicase YprA (DUF1998 family)
MKKALKCDHNNNKLIQIHLNCAAEERLLILRKILKSFSTFPLKNSILIMSQKLLPSMENTAKAEYC